MVTAYLASLSRHDILVQHTTAELCVRSLVTRGSGGRLRSLIRRGALADARPLACQLLSLGYLQLALDMMWRLSACGHVVEVLLGWDEPSVATGVAKQAAILSGLQPRKLLAAAKMNTDPRAFLAVYHALLARNERLRGSPHFLKSKWFVCLCVCLCATVNATSRGFDSHSRI